MQASANRTSEFVINSPFDGVVLERAIDPGSLVTTLDTILVLGNKEALIVEGKVDELDAGKVQLGQKVLMAFDGLSGQVLEGAVIFVAPKVDYSTKSFKIKIALSAPAPIRAGMSAELNILVTEKAQALLIPLKALQEKKVWVVDGDGRARLREVTTGLRDAQQVEITQGLVKGDIVVVSPLNLSEGTRVLKIRRINE